MTRSFAGPPYDLDELIPERAVPGRRTTLLLPERGSPAVRDRSLGGPMLWPADGPWPSCGQSGQWAWPNEKNPAGTVPMVLILQLFATDVPELPFSERTDVLRLVRCPLIHPHDQACAAPPRLYWREELAERFGMEYALLACAPQHKIGGYPAWNQPPDRPSCERGQRMEHLLSITIEEDLDMVTGDLGGIHVFLCRRCPELPYAHRYGC